MEIAKVGAMALMVMLNVMEAEFGGLAESVAVTVMEEGAVVAVVGVPLMAPVLGLRVRPAGSVPVARVQVTAPVPPIDCKAAL